MTSRDAPLRFLCQLAPHSAAEWKTLGTTTFAGDLIVATDNSVYAFRNGTFISRLKKPARFFDAPKAMRGKILVGFLHEDDVSDLWSLSPRWLAGSHAVLWDADGMDAA